MVRHKPSSGCLRSTGRSPGLAIGIALAAVIATLVAVNPFGGLTQATDLPRVCLSIAGIMAALLLPQGREAARALLRWRVAWTTAALLGWALLSALFSGRIPGAFFGTDGSGVGWPVMVVGAVVVLGVAARSSDVRAILPWAAVVLLGIQVVATGIELFAGTIPGGTLSNSSFSGEVVVLAVPLVLWTALHAKRPVDAAWRYGLCLAGVGVLIAAGARMSTVALMGALLVWAGTLVWARWGTHAGWIAFGGLAAVTVAGLSYVVAQWSAGLSRGALGDFWRSRAGLWDPAVRAIAARPLIGWGPDGYQYAVGKLAHRGVFDAWAYWPVSQDPHNIILWFGVSTGVVGILVATWFAAEVGRDWLDQARAPDGDGSRAIMTGVALYAVSAMATPAALQTLPVALVFLGASLRVESPRGRERGTGWVVVVTAVALAVAVVLGAYGVIRLTVADRLTAPAPAAAQRAADAVRFDPFLYYDASVQWGYAAQRSTRIQQQRLDLIAIERAVSLEPTNGLYQLELARTLVSYGASQADVRSVYQRALELAPGSPDARSSYAEYLLALGRTREAKTYLDAADRFARSTETARVYAEYYRAIGDEADALRYDRLRNEIAGVLAQPGGAQR